MIKASKIVSPNLQQHILVKTLATNNALSISIYKWGIPKIYLARKATLEYNIAAPSTKAKVTSNHQSSSQHNDEKKTTRLKIIHDLPLRLKLEYQKENLVVHL